MKKQKRKAENEKKEKLIKKNNELNKIASDDDDEEEEEPQQIVFGLNAKTKKSKGKYKYVFKLPEDLVRQKVRGTYLIMLIQYSSITLFVWLGCFFGFSDIINSNLWTMLVIFIPISIIGGLINLQIGIKYDEFNFGKKEVSIFLIPNIIIISFYCFLLSYFTEYKFIVWILISFDINYLIILIFLFFLNYQFILIFPLLLVLNTIIVIITYYCILDMTGSHLLNGSLVLGSLIIYNILYLLILRGKMKKDNEVKSEYWNSMLWTMIFSYSIYYPVAGIIISIYAIIAISRESCCINHCNNCYCKCYTICGECCGCECCNPCDCCHCCDNCDCSKCFDYWGKHM